MDKIRLFKYSYIVLTLLLAGCSDNDDAFDKSPSQRSNESITALKNELVGAAGACSTSPKPTLCCSQTPLKSSLKMASAGVTVTGATALS